MPDSHHIKTYIVFLLLSIFLVAVLVYLYFPSGKDVLPSSAVVPESTRESLVSSEPQNKAEKRILLTKLILRYQDQLLAIENNNSSVIFPSSQAREEKIQSLQKKIDELQRMIERLGND